MTAEVNVVRMAGANEQLRTAFLRWQCRLRQIAVREHGGRPGDGMVPAVFLGQDETPIGHVVTVLNRLPEHAKTMELRHLVRQTLDEAKRRENALKFLGELYYQRAREFSDTLTATFQPGSAGAARLVEAKQCRLAFEQYSQRYLLTCRVFRLSPNNPLRDATFWHNLLFNPRLPADVEVIGFEPDWARSDAVPHPAGHDRD